MDTFIEILTKRKEAFRLEKPENGASLMRDFALVHTISHLNKSKN